MCQPNLESKNMIYNCFTTNKEEVRKELLSGNHDEVEFKNKYALYCYLNLKHKHKNSSEPYFRKLISRYVPYPMDRELHSNTCGVFKDSFYFVFPTLCPIIDNHERILRIQGLVITLSYQRWSMSLVKYTEELRRLEIFQVLWKQIITACRNPQIKALLFIDLHLFCHFYVVNTSKSMNGSKERSIFEIIIEKLRFETTYKTEGVLLDLSSGSNKPNNSGMGTNDLFKKLRMGNGDRADQEMLYDLKQKKIVEEETGVNITCKEITILEQFLLRKSFNKEALLRIYLSSGCQTSAKIITEVKLIVRGPDNKLMSIYEGNVGDEVLIVRLLQNIQSISGWLKNKGNVDIKDIEPDGKYSSEVALERVSIGLIENVGSEIFYIKPSKNFEIIAHYTNYNGHIELGLIFSPEEKIKQICFQLMDENVSLRHNQMNIYKLLTCLINESYFSELDKLI